MVEDLNTWLSTLPGSTVIAGAAVCQAFALVSRVLCLPHLVSCVYVLF